MYTWVDLISSIGGQTGYLFRTTYEILLLIFLGLWIGVSLISFVEIAELLFLLLRHFIKTIYHRISMEKIYESFTNGL